MAKYILMKTEGRAKRAQFETVHGTIQTPVFMNVGTIGAIKGAVSTQDLNEIGTQVELVKYVSSCMSAQAIRSSNSLAACISL